MGWVLAERLDRLESRLEEISINNGEGRIGYLEKELQGYDLNDIEQGVEKLEKQLAELAESLADELEVIRREAKDYNKGLTEETPDLSVGLDAVKETIDDQAKKIAELSSKVEEESAEHEKQLTRGKSGLQEVRRDVSAADSQLRLLEQQQETQEPRLIPCRGS